MSRTHLENIDFDFIRYANCWEDPVVLLSALNVDHDSMILSIASGGDNCFSLASAGPKKVIAVDISAVQLYLVELKKEAIRILGREEYLFFAGFRTSSNRLAVYNKIKSLLSTDCQDYWNEHTEEIEEGIIHVGKFERYFQLFKKSFLHTVNSQEKVDGLFKPKSAEEQLQFYNDVWYDDNWKQMHSTFFSEQMLGEKGRDPEFMKQIEGSVSDLILEREVAHLKSKSCQTNAFLFYILNNRFDDEHLPHYVQEGIYEKVKANLDCIQIECGLIEKTVSKFPGITHFNLSNIFEYMDMDLFSEVAKQLIQLSSPQAKFAYWNFMIHRNMVDIYPEALDYHEQNSQHLSKEDKGYFYKGFILNQKK